MKIVDLLKDSNYKLSQFNEEDILDLENAITLKKTAKGSLPDVECRIRGKQLRLTPEEVIRQLSLQVLIDRYQRHLQNPSLCPLEAGHSEGFCKSLTSIPTPR